MNLPELGQLTYYGVQGLDTSSEDYLLHWDAGKIYPNTPIVNNRTDIFYETIFSHFFMAWCERYSEMCHI